MTIAASDHLHVLLAVFASAMGRPITKSSSIWLKTVHAPDSLNGTRSGSTRFPCQQRGGIRSPFCAMIAIPTARPANAKRRTGASMAEPNLCTFSIMRLYALSGCRVSGRRCRRSLPVCGGNAVSLYPQTKVYETGATYPACAKCRMCFRQKQ